MRRKPPPLIRSALPEDIPRLAALNAEVQELHVANRPDQFKRVDLTEIVECFAKLFQNSAAKIWVAEVDGAPVGYATVLPRERPDDPLCHAREWWEVDAIGVAAEHRRAGICSALLQKVIAEAKAHKIRDVELSSWAFNKTAHRAFESLGFTPKAVRYELRTDR